jgi:hypothetical protein
MKLFGYNIRKDIQETPLQTRGTPTTLDKLADIIIAQKWANNLNSLSFTSESNLWDIFNICAPLATVITKRGEFCCAGNFKVVDKKGNEILNDPLLDKLQKPNDLQTRNEFIKSVVTFASLYGFTHVYNRQIEDSIAYKNDVETAQIYALNYAFDRLQSTQNIGMFTDKSTIIIDYTENEIRFTIKDGDFVTVVDAFNDTAITGHSRVKSILQECNNIIKVRQSENAIISRPGGIGIIGSDSTGAVSQVMTPGELDAVNKKLNTLHGLVPGQSAWHVTTANIKATDLLKAYSDFGFDKCFDSNEASIVKAFNMPLGVYSSKTSTYENLQQEIRQYIEFECVPLMDNICNSLTHFFGYNKTSNKLIYDFSESSFFKKDENQEALTFSNLATGISSMILAKVITPEQGRQILIDYGIIKL